MALLEAISPRTCKSCQRPLGFKDTVSEYCGACTLDWNYVGGDRVSNVLFSERFNAFWGAVGFRLIDGKTRSIVHLVKYSGSKKLVIELGKWFAKSTLLPHENVVLLPVPIYWKRKLFRGYNQSELLAKGMSQIWNVEVDTRSIQRTAHKASLTGSDRRKRAEVIDGVFERGKEYGDLETLVLIVDDVLTTGSTLRACRQLLEDSGRTVLGAVVLAIA